MKTQQPENMQPDRDEVITSISDVETVEPKPGVSRQTLVGDFNTARDLMTGIVTIQPETLLEYHTHPCSESITVLDGEFEIAAEGRVYRLGPLDNIVIPRWLPHEARNPDSSNVARLHVALAMSVPQRDPVSHTFQRTEMPNDSTGTPGFERVTRFALAERSGSIGPGTEVINFFNASLMPGIEMSGGFGRFSKGGRLPDHLHDFDESICIIRGNATCLVEGRRYTLSDCQTAMVPRGRVHHFVNEEEDKMDMIWVYAGPMPERIIVEPSFRRECE